MLFHTFAVSSSYFHAFRNGKKHLYEMNVVNIHLFYVLLGTYIFFKNISNLKEKIVTDLTNHTHR